MQCHRHSSAKYILWPFSYFSEPVLKSDSDKRTPGRGDDPTSEFQYQSRRRASWFIAAIVRAVKWRWDWRHGRRRMKNLKVGVFLGFCFLLIFLCNILFPLTPSFILIWKYMHSTGYRSPVTLFWSNVDLLIQSLAPIWSQPWQSNPHWGWPINNSLPKFYHLPPLFTVGTLNLEFFHYLVF